MGTLPGTEVMRGAQPTSFPPPGDPSGEPDPWLTGLRDLGIPVDQAADFGFAARTPREAREKGALWALHLHDPFGIMVFMVVDLVAADLDGLHKRVAGRFGRAEPRARVRAYVSGLVVGLKRKNGWTLAERAGEAGPDGV